jgi:hypothetical protein
VGGADRFIDGAGADTFRSSSLIDSTVDLAGRDTVADFSRAQGDRLIQCIALKEAAWTCFGIAGRRAMSRWRSAGGQPSRTRQRRFPLPRSFEDQLTSVWSREASAPRHGDAYPDLRGVEAATPSLLGLTRPRGE